MEAGAVIVTFAHTLDAFAFEDAARASDVPGRIIPLPTGIAATCGLAWKLPPEASDELARLGERPRQGVYRYGPDGYHRLDA